MKGRKKVSLSALERKLIADADNSDAWEPPLRVRANKSARPEWYKRMQVVKLDPDVAQVFKDSESVNHALRALAGIIEHQAGKTTSR